MTDRNTPTGTHPRLVRTDEIKTISDAEVSAASESSAKRTEFVAVRSDQLTDMALLPRRFDIFAGEVRTFMDRMAEYTRRIASIETTMSAVEKYVHTEMRGINDRLERIEKLLYQLVDVK